MRHEGFIRKQSIYMGMTAVAVAALLQITERFQTTLQIPNVFQDFITLSLSIFVEAFPFLVLGAFLATLINTYVSPHLIHRILPKNGFARRAVLSVTGFLLPVCECGNVPLSRSLIQQGLKPSDSVSFLLGAPVLNPVTIWSTWVAFGYDGSIVISRIAATFLIANIIGFVLSLIKNENEHITESFQKTCHTDTTTKPISDKSLKSVQKQFIHEAFLMVRVLAFGALVAGAVQSFVPRDVLLSIGNNVVLSVLAMLALAFIVSICANVDAFFALSFATTFTAGSLVSFLVFGPMIDIKMLALLKTTFKTKTLLIISLLSFVLSLVTGLVVIYAF